MKSKWLSDNASFIRAYLQHLDTPLSLSTWLLFENEEWDQISLRWLDPLAYPEGVFSSLRFERDLAAVDLLRKYPLPTSWDRQKVALRSWEQAEDACYRTNEFLLHILSSSATPEMGCFSEFLGKVRKRIGRWLGRIPDDLNCRFGPGTCVEYEGRDPTVLDKMWLTPSSTPSASLYFEHFLYRTLWGRERLLAGLPPPSVTRGNRLATVPKDGKTDRPICIEPLGNLWLQLGVGSYLKSRLTHAGFSRHTGLRKEIFPGLEVSYPDPQQVSQTIAQKAWRDGYATVDLSSASDTISEELVRAVLPPDWFQLLDDLRSKYTFVSNKGCGRWRRLEKFSSMGNGFTFELETLIFGALLAEAFGLDPGRNLWVFGDDIILPGHHYNEACALLKTCGFQPNMRKSFASGPFRESCGGYFHSGRSVKPIRLKGDIDTIAGLFQLHNALRSRKVPQSVRRHVVEKVPRSLRLPGPVRLGDVVLHANSFPTKTKDGIQWVRILGGRPGVDLPLERWSPELHMAAICLGVPPRLVRRGVRVVPMVTWASIS
jgi:hypothetical protein